MSGMQRQFYWLIRLLAITLIIMVAWDLYISLSGGKSEFSYVVNEIEPTLISPDAAKLLNPEATP